MHATIFVLSEVAEATKSESQRVDNLKTERARPEMPSSGGERK